MREVGGGKSIAFDFDFVVKLQCFEIVYSLFVNLPFLNAKQLIEEKEVGKDDREVLTVL